MEPLWAGIAAAGVVLAVILLWKMVKLAFRLALIAAAAALIFYVARAAGWI